MSQNLHRMKEEQTYEIQEGSGRWWVPTSLSRLKNAEMKLISHVQKPVRGHYVNIGEEGGGTRLWTLSVGEGPDEEDKKKLPLVLVHGMGSASGLWVLNFDQLSANRSVHAIDLLGFGQSSRPKFSCDAMEAENQLVTSLEQWRETMKIEKFILLGHSFGGFLITSYAIKFPNRVASLILADPWGFPEQPKTLPPDKYPYPFVVKTIDQFLQYFYPYWGLRALGPLGPSLIRLIKPGLEESFKKVLGNGVDVADYIYHANAQPPSGETAFHWIKASFGWAKNPMCKRLCFLNPDIAMTFIYGSKSWVDQLSLPLLQKLCPNSRVDVVVMGGAGHHVYSDNSQEFNAIVLRACTAT